MSEDPSSAFERIFGRVARAVENSQGGGTSMRSALVEALKKQKTVVPADDAVEEPDSRPAEAAESKAPVSAFERLFGRVTQAPLDPKAGGPSSPNPFARPQNNEKPVAPAAAAAIAEAVVNERRAAAGMIFRHHQGPPKAPDAPKPSTPNPFARPQNSQKPAVPAAATPVAADGAVSRDKTKTHGKIFGSQRSVSKDPQGGGSITPNPYGRVVLNNPRPIVPVVATPAVATAPAPNAPHIALCLFDLDDTLIRTGDLDAFRGQANVGDQSPEYSQRLLDAYRSEGAARLLYTPDHLAELRRVFPAMKWGVFTRSPRHYATTLLDAAYPGVPWDVVIGYEDVRNTKPHGDGVWAAMRQCRVQSAQEVALVGDSKVDVQAAYQGGCWSILDESKWRRRRANERYWPLELLPDAIIEDPSMLGGVLEHPSLHWPELEHQLDSSAAGKVRWNRLDTINHFWPEGGWVPITVMGRLFGEYEALRPRRRWHALTDQILAHKDASKFPDGWINAIRGYLGKVVVGANSLVTVIPFKPGPERHPRLEALLAQVRASDQAQPIRQGVRIEFDPAVLAFRAGAVSSHGEHLTKPERFANVGQNMFVQMAETVRGKDVVVIDDVATTGATLLWAHRYLLQAGARSVKCMSLTKAVSHK